MVGRGVKIANAVSLYAREPVGARHKRPGTAPPSGTIGPFWREFHDLILSRALGP
jgi:hypothetical protein